MNNFFSFRRLLLLIKKQFSENVKLYLFGTLALLGLLAVFMLIFLSMAIGGNVSISEDIWIELYLWGLFISGILFANFSFNMLSNKEKGIYYFTLPASHSEKLVCALFFNIILFTIIYTLCYLLVSKIAIIYIDQLIRQHPEKNYFFTWIKPKEHSFEKLRNLFYAFFAVQAFYLLGSVYFRKFSFIFTTVIGALLLIAFIFLIISLSKIFNKYEASFNITNANGAIDGIWRKKYYLNHTISDIIVFLAKFIWAPFFWLVAWFRLKEKEI